MKFKILENDLYVKYDDVIRLLRSQIEVLDSIADERYDQAVVDGFNTRRKE